MKKKMMFSEPLSNERNSLSTSKLPDESVWFRSRRRKNPSQDKKEQKKRIHYKKNADFTSVLEVNTVSSCSFFAFDIVYKRLFYIFDDVEIDWIYLLFSFFTTKITIIHNKCKYMMHTV